MEHLEIERKFLVVDRKYRDEAVSKTRIVQGFLNRDPERCVRVRRLDDKGFLTVKGPSNASGTTRFEWELEISVQEANNLMDLCERGILEKVRYTVPIGRHRYQVDEFLGENKGLVVAELELEHEDEPFERPPWLGEEVTGQIKYYNSNLSHLPYQQW